MRNNHSILPFVLMQLAVAAIVMACAHYANAGTYYFIDGKEVTKAQAIRVSLDKPGTEVLKVQVNFTTLNEQTANLKKSRDAQIKDVPR